MAVQDWAPLPSRSLSSNLHAVIAPGETTSTAGKVEAVVYSSEQFRTLATLRDSSHPKRKITNLRDDATCAGRDAPLW
jgi:hypothetical protein